MKANKRLRIIAIMMVTAQVLITVLVVQWLRMQYSGEHKLLSENISRAWDAANQQMIDSMLMKQYINPIMDSSRNPNKKFNSRNVTIGEPEKSTLEENSSLKENSSQTSTSTRVITNKTDNDSSQRKLTFRFNHFSSAPSPSNGRRIFVHTDNQDSIRINTGNVEVNELVLRGVKLFVSVQHDSLGEKGGMGLPDTTLLKKALQVQLESVDPHITVIWKTDSINASGGDTGVIVAKGATGTTSDTVQKNNREYSYSIMVNDHAIQAEISGWKRVIAARMLPWGLFGVLLVVLSAAAFLVSYRSLRAQMLLNVQRNDFIRNMSHELRTPVATVKVALEAISDFNEESDRQLTREYLAMAILETNRLEMLINRVTDLMAEGKLHILTKREDVSGLLNEVARSMKPRLAPTFACLTLCFPMWMVTRFAGR